MIYEDLIYISYLSVGQIPNLQLASATQKKTHQQKSFAEKIGKAISCQLCR